MTLAAKIFALPPFRFPVLAWKYLLVRFFIWAAYKLFPVVYQYAPNDNGHITLAVSTHPDELKHACRHLLLYGGQLDEVWRNAYHSQGEETDGDRHKEETDGD